jgi:hypothetical protein
MDLNELYHRQQIELMRADGATCDRSRLAHQGLADIYGRRVSTFRRMRLLEAAA